MLKPSDIVTHLQKYLPRFTSLFNDLLVVDSASVTASDTVAVESVDHGLSPGNSVVFSGGTVENGITAVSLSGSTLTFTTATEHDYNAPELPAIPTTVTMSGFTNAAYNTTHTLIGVPNRTKFQIALPTGETVAPTLNSNEVAIENRSAGLKGIWTVATTPDDDNFTVTITDTPDLPVGTITGLSVATSTRVGVASDVDRARQLYTQQTGPTKLWAFVVMGDVNVSKDRHTYNDGVAGFTAQDFALLRLLQNFFIVVFTPINDSLNAQTAQDNAYDTVFQALMNALYLYGQSTSAVIDYLTVPVGHGGRVPDDTAVYEHVYEWQLISALNYEEGVVTGRDVAFRDIDAVFELFGDAEANMDLNINLDEDP